MAITVHGTSGITYPDSTVQVSAGYPAFKNRIINGAMMIDQRNAGALVSNANGVYTVDRMSSFFSSGTITAQQQSGGPTGFSKFLRYTVSSAGTRNAADYSLFTQIIEGNNVADFGEGSVGASNFTFSFWVRSSLAGLYSGCVNSGDNTRGYGFTFTINAANTWEQKSVTITGDTSGGTVAWPIGTGTGMFCRIDLGSGSDYQLASTGSWLVASNKAGVGGTVGWAQTAGATFDLTGVQLEKGSTATSFDYRPYGTELALCQRYYQKATSTNGAIFRGSSSTTGAFYYWMPFSVLMRAAPTMSIGTPTYSNANSASWANIGQDGAEIFVNITAGGGYGFIPWTSTAEL